MVRRAPGYCLRKLFRSESGCVVDQPITARDHAQRNPSSASVAEAAATGLQDSCAPDRSLVPTDMWMHRTKPIVLLSVANQRGSRQTPRGMSSGLRIKDLPIGERPRERLLSHGAESLRSADLIAILLRTGLPGLSAVHIAEQLLARYGTLDLLARASLDELRQTKGVGRDKAIALKSAFTLARRMAEELRQEPLLVDTPERVADVLRESNRFLEVEQFQVLLLNTRRRLIRVEAMAHGTLDTLLVHPREVFRAAIVAGAASVVLAHNHPSGDPTPSEADIRITRDLIRAGQLLRIEVVDHIIMGRPTQGRPRDFVSLRELGHFYS
jgi:DNA repair protein RadC